MRSIWFVKVNYNYRLFTSVRICAISDRIVANLERKSGFQTCPYAI